MTASPSPGEEGETGDKGGAREEGETGDKGGAREDERESGAAKEVVGEVLQAQARLAAAQLRAGQPIKLST